MQSGSLDIDICAEKLRQEIATHSEISIEKPAADLITIQTPFKTGKAKSGAIILNSQERRSEDPLDDLPANQLKRIVRGIIWRDKHFAGPRKKILPEKAVIARITSTTVFKKALTFSVSKFPQFPIYFESDFSASLASQHLGSDSLAF